jgi:chaperonin GroEL (HSP60 family)
MAFRQVLFRSAARETLLHGAAQPADAVRVTLGPKAKSVLILRKWGVLVVCNDGVTIAKEFDLKDPEEALGAQMLRQAAVKTGVQILRRALETPTRQIAENSAEDAGLVVSRMLEGKGNFGFDAARKEYVDLFQAGIIDPTKVVRIALENAVSVAGVLLLTKDIMTEIPEPKVSRRAEPEMIY